MDDKTAAKLRARIDKLRALQHDDAATPGESASAKANADRLQARLDAEPPARNPAWTDEREGYNESERLRRNTFYPPPPANPPRSPNQWLDEMMAQDKQWYYVYVNRTDNTYTVIEDDGDIVEEDYRYDDEEGDY